MQNVDQLERFEWLRLLPLLVVRRRVAKSGLLLVVEGVIGIGLQIDDGVKEVVLGRIVVQGAACRLLNWQGSIGLNRAGAELHLLAWNRYEIDQVLWRCVPWSCDTLVTLRQNLLVLADVPRLLLRNWSLHIVIVKSRSIYLADIHVWVQLLF